MNKINRKGQGLYFVNATESCAEEYNKIVGFELTVKKLEQGSLGGGAFDINALVVSQGYYDADDFAMSFDGTPRYAGKAKELVTFSDSYGGTMFFSNAKNVTFTEENTTIHFESENALFDDTNSILTFFGVFGVFEILDIQWIVDYKAKEKIKVRDWPEMVDIKRFTDISTVEHGSEGNLIDIETPNGTGPFPVILWVHGGGWTQLNRKSCFIRQTMNYLISKGYALVSAEYTLSRIDDDRVHTGYPQMIFDLKAAVRYIRAYAQQYNLDPRYIVAMGESAGAHLSALLGTTNGRIEYEDLRMGNENYSSDVQAIVGYFGPYDLVGLLALAAVGSDASPELVQQVSPICQLNSKTPPIFLTHGRNDQVVPVEQSYMMEEKARTLLGNENVVSLYYDDAPHASIGAFDTLEAAEAVESFISKHYKNT